MGVAPAERRQEKREGREMLLRVLFMVEAAPEAKSFSISSSVRPLVSGTVVVLVGKGEGKNQAFVIIIVGVSLPSTART